MLFFNTRLPEMDIYLFLPVPIKMTAIYIKEKMKSIIFDTLMCL